MTRILLAIAACLAAQPVRAEPGADPGSRPLKELSLEELMEVDIRAPTKAEQPIRKAPAVGSVVTRGDIEAYGWLTLADILFRQPGFAPSQDFERITVAGRGQHESWNNNHLRLLIDGVPANNTSNGTAPVWESVPLTMVESIEILRSQGSALYGSNAINGVVAINTRRADSVPAAEISVRAGGEETHWEDVAGAATLPWFTVVGSYGWRGTRGNVYETYDASGRTAPGGGLRRFETNDRRSTNAAFLKLEGDGPLEGFTALANYSWWEFETGHGWLLFIPDERERAVTMEGMTRLSWAPPPLARERLRLEFVGQWMRRSVDYRIRQVPDSLVFLGNLYPDGITEISRTSFQDFFLRAQADFRTFMGIRALAGIENTFAPTYEEEEHGSNVDLNRGGTLQPFPDRAFHGLKPVYEAVIDQPSNNLGAFAQLESGEALSRSVLATVGARYDLLSFDYIDLDAPGQPIRNRSLDQFSPRAALVVLPTPNLSLKALAERSFRAPAPSELFSRNSLLGNSDPNSLEPEEITVYTLAGDLSLFHRLNLRADGFLQEMENQIGFSGTTNSIANLYSRQVAGIEAEALGQHSWRQDWKVEGFLNYTWVTLLDEDALLPGLEAEDHLTWSPGHSANIGAALRLANWEASAQGHWQGRVYRRDSDRFQADGAPTAFSAYRPASVDPWFTLDALVGYRFSNGLRLWAQARNLLDAEGYLARPGDFPFDYRFRGFRVLAGASIAL